jgi:uncharacterized membrane protein YfcA
LLTLLVDGHAVPLLGVAALGTAVGFVAGMFGVGGGFLLIPLLHVVLGVPIPAAVGVGLCQTIAVGLGSLLRYAQMGHAEARFDLMLIGGSVMGTDAGTRLLAALERVGTVAIAGRSVATVRLVITAGYAALFFVMAALLWWRTTSPADVPGARGPFAKVRIPPYADFPNAGVTRVSGPFAGWIGFANGVIAGLLGVGGGIVLIPIMMYGFGFDVRKAAGTGIIAVLVVAVIGTVQHARHGNVHLGLVATVMIGAALAAQVGANLTRTLQPRTLRRGLALVLVATVGALAFKLVV